ncbi:MAG: hypothetical protein J6N49_04805 [Alphaproteobacteria bacterium]|nr:hypothetical protein [Alphaproteobacteria bacterium]
MVADENIYRVVCSRDSYDGKYYIDIIPAKWAIHQLVMDTRKRLNSHAEDVAGAIFLYDRPDSAEPKIEFLAKKDYFLLTDYWPYDKTVFPKMEIMIKEKFAQMKADGVVTTISRYDLDNNYGVYVSATEQDYPKSAAEERVFKAKEDLERHKKLEEDKKIRYQNDHIDPIQKMRWNQYKDCER